MTKDEALKLAQRALSNKNASTKSIYEALAAIKEVLAQPEESHAPFEYWNAVEGWVKIEEVREHFDSVGCGTIYKTAGEGREPLYTSPPKRPWVELTDEDVEIINGNPWDVREAARMASAKSKEKNT